MSVRNFEVSSVPRAQLLFLFYYFLLWKISDIYRWQKPPGTHQPALITVISWPVFDVIHPLIILKQIPGIVSYINISLAQFYLLYFGMIDILW